MPISCRLTARRAAVLPLRCLLVITLASCAGGRASESLLPRAAPEIRDYRGELSIAGRPSAIALDPRGNLWLATLTGHLYTAPGVDADWRAVAEERVDTSVSQAPGRTLTFSRVGLIHGIAFADERHGVAWGAMRADRTAPARVYVTDDGGTRWRHVDVGDAFSFQAAHLEPKGEIWLAGYRQLHERQPGVNGVLFRSVDFGRTWEPRVAPLTMSPSSVIAMDGSDGILAALDNQLFVTRDRGGRWAAVPTPLDQGRYERTNTRDRFARISHAAIAGGWIVLTQDGHTFFTRVDSIDWRRWHDDPLVLYERDAATGRMCAVTSTLRFVVLDDSLIQRRVGRDTLHARPIAGSCRGGRLLTLDTEDRLTMLDERTFVHGWPLTADGPRRTMRLERHGRGAVWGTTGRHLYRQDEEGRWYRLPYDASTVRGLIPSRDGRLFIWDGHGINALFDERTGTTRVVESLAGRDVVDVATMDEVWIAFGGQQYETARRVEVAQSFFPGQFRGSLPHGFVAVSRDSGATWREIDRWPEGGVAALYAAPDARRIVLLSHLGSVRELVRRGDSYEAATLLLATGRNRDSVPYVQWPRAIHFANDSVGWVSGTIHHVGERFFATADGGRTWRRAQADEFPYLGVLPWESGHLGWTRSGIWSLGRGSGELLVDLSDVAGAEGARIIDVAHGGEPGLLLVRVSRRGEPQARLIVNVRARSWTEYRHRDLLNPGPRLPPAARETASRPSPAECC